MSPWLEAWRERLRPYYLRGLYFPLRPAGRPRSFQTCWQHRWEPLAGARIASPDASPSYVFLPMTEWHGRMQREQHLARALSQAGHRCYYFNPNLGRQYEQIYDTAPETRISDLGGGLHELHIRLPSEPVFHHRLLTRAESERIADGMEPVAVAAGRDTVVVVGLPTWTDLALLLRERHGWPIVYNCHDFLPGFREVSRAVIHHEEELFGCADYVLFASHYLADVCQRGWPGLRGRSAVLPNAADYEHFRAASSAPRPHNPVTAGYFGAIEEWFDVEAVRRSAERHPDIRFELIGRVDKPEAEALRGFANVHLLGELDYDALPERLAGFDIALLPFRDTPLTRAASPIKLYEYFAAGIPVVARRLPELEAFEEYVTLAGSAPEFARMVGQAAGHPGPREARIGIARRETWECRGESLLEIARALAPQPAEATVITG